MDGKRLRAVVFSVVGTIGVLASVLAVDQPDGPSGWVLLLVGSVAAGVLCGLAAVGPEAPAQDDAGTPGRPAAEPATDAATSQSGRPAGGAPQTTAAPGRQALRRLTQGRRPRALTVTAALAAVVLAVVAAPTLAARIWPSACPQPVELRVLTSPDQLTALQPVARAYERATADRRGCPGANLYLYALPTVEAVRALRVGWGDPMLDQPRPDAWLVNSQPEADRVADRGAVGPQYMMDLRAPIAVSPLVLGYLGTAAPGWTQTAATWAEVLRSARGDGWEFVRADPGSFPSGLTARAAVLASYAVTPDEVDVEINLWERSIVQTMGGGAYRVDDEAGDDVLLRQYEGLPREATASTAAIVTEQALARHNQGREGGCGSAPALRAYYPTDTRHVVLEFARLRWADSTDSPQEAVAADFGRWLQSDERGQRAIAEAGLRPLYGQSGGPLTPDCGVRPGAPAGDAASDDLLRAAAQYPPPVRGRLLLLLDTSGSMREPVEVGGGPGDGQRSDRLSLAIEAVRGALAEMTSQDEFGLWEFPSDRGVVGEVVPWRPAPDSRDDPSYLTRLRDSTAEAVSKLKADGSDTPLFKAIRAGVQGLAPADDEAQDIVRALVVVSDGKDTDGGHGRKALIDAAKDRRVRIFVLAVGELSCSANHLTEIAEETGGVCREATPVTLDSALDRLVRGVWGGGDVA